MRSQRFLQIILGFGSDLDIDSPLLQISISNLLISIGMQIFNNLQSSLSMGNTNIPLISSLIESKKPRTAIKIDQRSIINRTINDAIGLKNVIDQQASKTNEINSKKINKNEQNIMQLQMKYSMQERLSLMQCIELDQQQFNQKWSRLELLLKDVINFKLMFLQPKNAEGQRLLRNGCFLVLWMKILQQNSCININMVCKNVRDKYLNSVVEERVYLLQYLDEHQKMDKVDKVQMNKGYTLKRNGIKKGERYVSFADERPMSKEQRMKLERENELQKIRSEVGYLLDYFQINDIYLLTEVTIVGVIKQIEDQLAIIVVKPKNSIKQVTCIGVLPKFKSAQSDRLFKSIERQYENLSYLELNGLETSQLWINSLQTEKLP